MAKGKHAAAAAKKRLSDAEERVSELARLREEESKAAHAREEELKAEVAALANRFLTKVEEAAQERVSEIERREYAAVRAAKKRGEERVVAGLTTLSKELSRIKDGHGWIMSPDGWERSAEAFGLPFGEFLRLVGSHSEQTRAERRIRPEHLQRGKEIENREDPRRRVAEVIMNVRGEG